MHNDSANRVAYMDSSSAHRQEFLSTFPANQAPRLLIFHCGAAELHSLRHTLQHSGVIVGVAETPDAVRDHLTESSWDMVLVCLDSAATAGLEVLRFVQGSGLMLASIALLSRMDASLLAALAPLQLQALLVQPVQTQQLLQTLEQCHVRVLEQRREEQSTAWLHEQIQEHKNKHDQLQMEMEQLEHSIVNALLDVLALREADCIPHALRVQTYAKYFARTVQYPESLLPHLERAALLHDLGKVGLSDPLLFRHGALTPAEVDRMQSHAATGEQILSRIRFLRPAAQIVRHHHERYDGQGFPDQLRGDQIPLGARIFAIADAWDALTSDRAYRAAQSCEAARQEMERCAGGQFDPNLIRLFLQVPLANWMDLRRQVEDRLHLRKSNAPRTALLAFA